MFEKNNVACLREIVIFWFDLWYRGKRLQSKSANFMVGPARLTDEQVVLQQKTLRTRSISALPSFHDAGGHSLLKAPDMMQVADVVEHFVAVHSLPSALSVKKFPLPCAQHALAESAPAMTACSPQDLSWRFKFESAAALAAPVMGDAGFGRIDDSDGDQEEEEDDDEELVALAAVRQLCGRMSDAALLRRDADGVSKHLSGEWHFADSEEVLARLPRRMQSRVCNARFENVCRSALISNHSTNYLLHMFHAQDVHLPTFTSDIF